MNKQEIKELLDFKVKSYNAYDFIETDPIQIPHSFTKKEDVEISSLLVSTIAWGNRASIIKNGRKMMDIMELQPHKFILNYTETKVHDIEFVHRTFNKVDLDFFFRALQNIYKNHGGLESAFKPHPIYPGAMGRIINFRDLMLSTPHEKRSEKHISNPAKKSAAKRLNMFLRWMVRNDNQGVDFGIWNSIPSSDLMLPLDVHTGNVARKLGLLKRKQNDWPALEELMKNLRKFDKLDPVKYDYALFGLGAFDKF